MLLWVPPGLASKRLFAIYNPNGTIADPSIAYPLRHETIPIEVSAAISLFVPISIYLLMFLRIRSFWDLNNAVNYILISSFHSF